MPTIPRPMAAGAAGVVTAAWRRLKRRRTKPSEKSPVAAGHDAPQTGLSHALAVSRTMKKTNARAISPSMPDESTDDRPQLVAHDISERLNGPLVAFYNPDGRTLAGEIIYCENPSEVRR